MNKEKVLKEAIDYAAEIALWVKEVYEWHTKKSDDVETADSGGSNPPPPPPPPPGHG